MKVLLLILCLAFTASAQTKSIGKSIKDGKGITDWVPVSSSADARLRAPGAEPTEARIEGEGQALLSFAGVQRSDDGFKGWARFVYPTSAIVLEGKWNEVRMYIVGDCRKNEINAMTGIAYGVDGNIRAEQGKNVLATTVPGSMGRVLFEYFCERGGPAVVAPTLKTKP